MRKPRFDIKIFKQHREALAAHFHDGALILVAHPEYIRNNDVHHNYRQDSNFFYLTGFEEPESIFVFRPGKVPETVLFVRPKDVERETWDGFRFGPDTAQREFGMDKAYTMSEFAAQAPELLSDVSRVFYRLYAFSEYDQLIESALLATKDKLRRSGRGLLTIEDPTSIIGEHRMFKSAQ